MDELRFALIGTGFWSQFQLAAWQELRGARCVALCNRTKSKAESLAERFGVPAVYSDVEEMLSRESLDFVDIVTDVDSHPKFASLAMTRGLSAICQKPMASSLLLARQMVEEAARADVQLLVHENWRWQAPLAGSSRFSILASWVSLCEPGSIMRIVFLSSTINRF